MSKIDFKKLLTAAVAVGVTAAAQAPNNDLRPSDVPVVTMIVGEQIEPVIADAQARIDHAANTEAHWWQKRSRWSAIIGLVFTVATPLAARLGLDLGESERSFVIDTAMALGGVWAAYLAFRAGVATKPLGQ